MRETELNSKLKKCFNNLYHGCHCEHHVASRHSKSYPDLFGIFYGISYRIECKMIKIAKIKSQRYLIIKRDVKRHSGLSNPQADMINLLQNSTDATFIVYHKYIKPRHKDNGLYLIPSSEIMINETARIADFLSVKPKINWEKYFCPAVNKIGFDIKKVFEREMKLHVKKISRYWKHL